MSTKKSSKTSHVLNLITNRIGTAEEDEDALDEIDQLQAPILKRMQETQSAAFNTAEPVPVPTQQPEVPQPNVQPAAETTVQEAATQPEPKVVMQSEATPQTAEEDPFSWAAQPAAVPPSFTDDWDDFSFDESAPQSPSVPAAVQQPVTSSTQRSQPVAAPRQFSQPVAPPTPPAAAPVPPIDPEVISDRIRQGLEEHLDAAISPMTLQDFSDPRQQRSIELPITGLSPDKQRNEDYAIDNEELVYVNIMEELVLLEYENLMRRIDVCDCKRCRNDVIAISLNKLPPKYVVTKRGYLITKLSSYNLQYHADVLSTVTGSCLRVKKYPNHDEDICKKPNL